MLPEVQLSVVLPTLPRISVHGHWCRAIGYHLLQGPPPGLPAGSPPRPLWPGGAPRNGARFTPRGGFDSIYLASDPITALLEVTAIFNHPSVQPFTLATYPWALFAVDGIVHDVLDLSDRSIWPSLGTDLQELTGDWAYQQEGYLLRSGPLPPTQILGRAAYSSACIRGIRYPSAKNIGKGVAIVVFSDRLEPGGDSYIEVHDPHGNIKDRVP